MTVTQRTVGVKSVKKKVAKVSVIKEKQSRLQILQAISDNTGLKRVDVESVFTEMKKIIEGHMKKTGSGEVMIPKLGVKLRRIRRKPTKKRVMVSPLTGQEVVIPSKPARDDIKLVAMKVLKEAIV